LSILPNPVCVDRRDGSGSRSRNLGKHGERDVEVTV
jgi:hypothetical protein